MTEPEKSGYDYSRKTPPSPLQLNFTLPKMGDLPKAAPKFPEPKVEFPKFHAQETVPGIQLDNYTRREPSEDGQYVLITTHAERIEKIKQPPTPEEIAEAKAEKAKQAKKDKIFNAVAAGFGLLFLGGLGFAAYKDEQKYRNAPVKSKSATPEITN